MGGEDALRYLLLGREGKLLAPSHTTPVACFLSPALPNNTAPHNSVLEHNNKTTWEPRRDGGKKQRKKGREETEKKEQKVKRLMQIVTMKIT